MQISCPSLRTLQHFPGMRTRLVCAGVVSAFLLVPLAAGAAAIVLAGAKTAPTPDQQLVSGLTTMRGATRGATAQLARPSPDRVARARAEIARSLNGGGIAERAAKGAVGALEIPSVRAALEQARTLVRKARANVAARQYSAAQAKLTRASSLATEALLDFGVPLAKEFQAFAVNRNFDYLPEFVNFSGLSARVGTEITEVVIGGANRSTANVGEQGAVADATVGLPITRMSTAVISDPIGRFSSGWCELDAGVITCRIRPAMPTSHVFTIAFGPKLPAGTKLLVKFRSAAGERSYSVFTTR
jgi:hypothetical protein